MSRQYVGHKSKEIEQELESLGTSIKDLEYAREFEVPKGYFENQKTALIQEAMAEIASEPSLGGRVISLWKPIMGVAVAFALGIIVMQGYNEEETPLDTMDDIEMATLENYLLDQAEYLDSDIAVNYDLIEIIE